LTPSQGEAGVSASPCPTLERGTPQSAEWGGPYGAMHALAGPSSPQEVALRSPESGVFTEVPILDAGAAAGRPDGCHSLNRHH